MSEFYSRILEVLYSRENGPQLGTFLAAWYICIDLPQEHIPSLLLSTIAKKGSDNIVMQTPDCVQYLRIVKGFSADLPELKIPPQFRSLPDLKDLRRLVCSCMTKHGNGRNKIAEVLTRYEDEGVVVNLLDDLLGI